MNTCSMMILETKEVDLLAYPERYPTPGPRRCGTLPMRPSASRFMWGLFTVRWTVGIHGAIMDVLSGVCACTSALVT